MKQKSLKVIMFCPKCMTIFETDLYDDEVLPYQIDNDSDFNGMNQAAYENCECNEDYIYLDEVSKLELLIKLSKNSQTF